MIECALDRALCCLCLQFRNEYRYVIGEVDAFIDEQLLGPQSTLHLNAPKLPFISAMLIVEMMQQIPVAPGMLSDCLQLMSSFKSSNGNSSLCFDNSFICRILWQS